MIGQEARYKQIHSLLHHPASIRNVSIVAHVDHGKTTLADCLIASNGIIHRKQAGQLRLLDDRLDEQDRGITMKASSIALIHKEHLINLIDSPGHLEFYSEVSAALRLTDAALLVVDTVEGVSSQTYRVLQQLYSEKLPAVLVLNKVDKLITHCQMQPLQAYNHLNQVIEHVNAILGSFISKEFGKEHTAEGVANNNNKTYKEESGQQPIDALEDHFYFSPEKKNIVFASALDNWGFSVQSFSGLIAKKLGKEPVQVEKYLWGDYYYHPKTKSFSQQPRNQNDKPLCVDWVLKPIWDIFENVQNDDQERLGKVITALGLKVSEAAKKAKGHALTKEILNSWLPLDRLLLDRIVEQLPNPIHAQRFRLPYLLQLGLRNQALPPAIEQALSTCSNSPEAPLVAFVSKMVTFSRKQVNQRGLQHGIQGNEIVIGFGRIFAGRVRRGQEVLVIGAKPKKITAQNGEIIQVPDITTTRVSGLYFFNGQYPEGVEQAYAGNVIGLAGLQNDIFKSGTISTAKDCLSFVPFSSQTKSILKVSVSTPDIKNGPKLVQGLKKLNRSDPSVDVYVESTGDYILNTCGQVHLEKCIVDLQTIYCKVPIKTSDPIITLRETITWSTLLETKNQKYLQELAKRRAQEQKRAMKEQFKAEMLADAELDQLQKEKQRAVREWDQSVEIYQSEDLTVEDTRFFFKSRDDVQEEKEAFLYKKEKEVKKVDHKNRGRMHTKQKFLNLNLKTNLVTLNTPNMKLALKVRALGLPFLIAEYLDKQSDRMQKLFTPQQHQQSPQLQTKLQRLNNQRQEFIKEMMQQFDEHGLQQAVKQRILNKLVCFGPNSASGSNLLLAQNIKNRSFIQRVNSSSFDFEQTQLLLDEQLLALLQQYKTTHAQLFTAIKNGFWLACQSGPLANQQMMGVIFILEGIKAVREKKELEGAELKAQQREEKRQERREQKERDEKERFPQEKVLQKEQDVPQKKEEPLQQPPAKAEQKPEQRPEQKPQSKPQAIWATDNFGPLAGQVISTMKDGCIQSFLGGGPRLVQPMYLCQLHTDQQYYGSIHNQLSKRRSQIISEDLHEFSNAFIIKAYLPMLESHNFCFDVLDKTQGTVNAQLDLDTWKIIEEDPFFTPLTIEEIEENGLESNIHNTARIILEKIRQKKGLVGTQKIVVAAEKQRTLKKN